MKNNFVAIDIETAQGKRWSICQIGLAIVENGILKKTITQLIQPPNNEYTYGNIKVHKITPEMTHDKPFFPEVWQKIYPLIENKKLVAHNVSFDINCLHQTLGFYNLDVPNFDCNCTYKLTGQKLSEACDSLDISLENHHDAGCDAEACAKIYLKLSENNNSDFSAYQPKSKKVNKNKKTVVIKSTGQEATKLIFEGKTFCFTGRMAELSRSQSEKEVRSRAGLTQKTINNQLDYLVIGSIPSTGWKHGNYGRKIEKAQELIGQNLKLKLVSEDDFI